MIKRALLIALATLAFAGCDQVSQKLGLEDSAKKEAAQQAEGKAVGSACRQSGRAIEDCYAIYSWLPKASIYEGWLEMDGYMRDNKMETITPQLPPPEAPGATKKRKKAEPQAATDVAVPAAEEKASAKEENTSKIEEKSVSKH